MGCCSHISIGDDSRAGTVLLLLSSHSDTSCWQTSARRPYKATASRLAGLCRRVPHHLAEGTGTGCGAASLSLGLAPGHDLAQRALCSAKLRSLSSYAYRGGDYVPRSCHRYARSEAEARGLFACQRSTPSPMFAHDAVITHFLYAQRSASEETAHGKLLVSCTMCFACVCLSVCEYNCS